MGIFDRYVISNFIKVFSTVTFVSLGLAVLYSLTNFLLGFKVKDLRILLDYILTIVPLSFYILSPLLVSLSTILFFRRVFLKRADLTVMSFGISPLRFVSPILFISLALSLAFLILNESFFPRLFKSVWYIEKTYKKKKKVDTGRIVRNIWFVKETGGGKVFAYIGNLDVYSGKFTDVFMLKVSDNNRVLEVVEGIIGVWTGDRIEIISGQAYIFEEGTPIERLKNFSLKVGINREEVGLFAEKISHLKTSALITLYTKGSNIGLEVNRYLSEIIYRFGMSFYPFLTNIFVIYILVKKRSVRKGFVGTILILIGLWTVITSAKLLTDKAGSDPKYALIGFFAVGIFVLKGVYDLRKGFRI